MTYKDSILPPQDNERVDRLMRDVFTPHLQKALEEARSMDAPFNELLSASAMSYATMLEMTLGKPAACGILRQLATHLELTDRTAPSPAN
ncbi:hypothetical protein [Terrihabitans sp. B22-R8]|uniref:hypothetical protein n=1 Tax=Terrihabitans sp. B22-R8 TaxID=3425128 RepID=UPI00403D2CF9